MTAMPAGCGPAGRAALDREPSHVRVLDENAPDAMKAFWAFDKAAFEEGALSVVQKQLIAVGVALTTQCPYCIELHTKSAREAGADDV